MLQANLLWKAATAVSVSIVILLIYTLALKVDLPRITSVGFPALALAGLAVLARLFVQGTRFHLIVSDLHGKKGPSLAESTMARMASEFMALITPTNVGGEPLRIGWLTRKGVDLGRAIWASYLEVLYDVVAGTVISIIAAAYAASRGSYLVALIILTITLLVLGFYISLAWFSARERLRLPKVVIGLVRRIFGAGRAKGVEEEATRVLSAYSEARARFLGSSSPKAVLKLSTLTFLMVLLAGVPVWVIFDAFGVKVDLFLSVLSFYASATIGAIPITPGGSGLSELGLSLYASGVMASSAWEAVVLWRLISYHLPLVACAMAILAVTQLELRAGKGKPRVLGVEPSRI